MSDNLNEKRSLSADEASRRAERINAIKNSVRSTSSATALEERPVQAQESAVNETSPDSSWEAALAERIDRHTAAPAPKRVLTLEEILAELDNSAGSSVPVSSEPSEVQESAPEAAVYGGESLAETSADTENLIKVNEEPDVTVPEKRTAPIRKLAPLAAVRNQEPPAEKLPEESDAEESDASETVGEDSGMSSDGSGKMKKKGKKKKKKKTLKESFHGLFPRKGDSIPERIRKLVFLGAVAVIIVCGYMIGDYYIDLWRSSRENNKYMQNYWDYDDTPTTSHTSPNDDGTVDDRKVYTLLDGAEYFLNINKDVVGVIRIPDTPVNNPVMQSDDNDEYLDKKMNGRESRAGELFLDYRNNFDRVDKDGHLEIENSDNLIIYGHNMKDEQMFGCLKSYERDESFYGKHPIIELNSNYEKYTYKIFSVFLLDAEDESSTEFDCWNNLDFDSEEDFYEFVNEAKKRTICLNEVDVKYGDKLLTLSTCNTLLGDRGRLIVMARLVRDGEDPMEGTQNNSRNPNIKWPTLFYQYRPSAKKYDPDAEFVPYGEARIQETTSGE